jgi:hypothetical protein
MNYYLKKTTFYLFLVLVSSIALGQVHKVKDTASILKKIKQEIPLPQSIYTQNLKRAKLLQANAKKSKNTKVKSQLLLKAAKEYLRAGVPTKSIEILKMLLQDKSHNKYFMDRLNYDLAVSYFRIGEKDNCIFHHNTDSCIYPIKGKGVHTQRKGASEALNILKKLILKNPKDPKIKKYKWLEHIFKMALGKYKFTKEVKNTQYISGKFVDMAKEKNVNLEGRAGGVIIDDFNNDGMLDIIASSWGIDDSIQYLENVNNKFINKTKQAELEKITGGLNIVQADYNNDGFLDLFIPRGAWRSMYRGGNYPNTLLKNNGDGTFTDVTIKAGLLSYNPTQSAVWIDFDTDGHLDLFIGNELSIINNKNNNWELYKNLKNGKFQEVSQSTRGIKLDGALIKSVSAGDFDNDGKIDLYISIYNQKNRLFKNIITSKNSNWAFKEHPLPKQGPESIQTFASWFWDLDNDGDLDIFSVNYNFLPLEQYFDHNSPTPLKMIKSTPLLYINDGHGNFESKATEFGLTEGILGMGANFGDINNDGYLDFYIGTGAPEFDYLVPNKMYINQKGKKFIDVTEAMGVGHLQKGHGISFADIDLDGDLDLYAVMGGAYDDDKFWNALFVNPGNNNSWIKLKLIGVKSNRSAIGTKIKIITKTKLGNEQSFYRTVSSGGSFGSNPLQQEIGLGKSLSISSIHISWPGSVTWTLLKGKIKINTSYIINESLEEIIPFNKNKL